ncbi:MAG: hypothetical protein Ct9H300mP11_32850 [Chloroflexota bacterium]|nr:MAG: hypothetical protein Ct9H300mP11_32850 [Chloroflexota bacterium]
MGGVGDSLWQRPREHIGWHGVVKGLQRRFVNEYIARMRWVGIDKKVDNLVLIWLCMSNRVNYKRQICLLEIKYANI